MHLKYLPNQVHEVDKNEQYDHGKIVHNQEEFLLVLHLKAVQSQEHLLLP